MDEKALPNPGSTDELPGPLPCDLRPPRSGDICSSCGQGKIDYNGLLELECPACGHRYGGEGAGCT